MNSCRMPALHSGLGIFYWHRNCCVIPATTSRPRAPYATTTTTWRLTTSMRAEDCTRARHARQTRIVFWKWIDREQHISRSRGYHHFKSERLVLPTQTPTIPRIHSSATLPNAPATASMSLGDSTMDSCEGEWPLLRRNPESARSSIRLSNTSTRMSLSLSSDFSIVAPFVWLSRDLSSRARAVSLSSAPRSRRS